MNDYKKKYFIGVLGTHFDFQIIEDTWDKDVIGHDQIEEFLHKAQISTLWTYVDEDNGRRKIRFQKELQNTNNKRVVIFSKIKPLALNDENLISSLQVISLQGPPTTALYHALNNVFSPLILKSQKRNVNQNNIERQLANLQAGLRTTILTNNLDSDPLKHVDINGLSVILNLEHEIEFWSNAIQSVKSTDAKASYASFRDILIPLSKEFSILEALPLPEVEDLLENAHNVLDDLWRHEPPYPKGRMEHLMDVIASEVIKRLSRDISKINFWVDDFNTSRDVLEQCLSTGNRWINTCKQLTHIFWPNYSLHPWVGDYFVPMNLMDIINGLQEIYDIRNMHRQLTRLLTTNEQQDLISGKVFHPFKDLQVLNYGPHTEHEWRTAKKQFEYLLQPAEQRLAQKLKKQLSGVKANTRQLLYEYSRYSELISRPTLKQTLQNERQYLLEALREYVKTLTNTSAEVTRNLSARFDTPEIICEISSARQVESKANEILKISKKILDDLQNYDDLIHNVTELLNNAKQQHTELFESWCLDRMGQIKNKTLSLKENDPVVQFSEDKLMRVSYSPELVTMISEVRQLSAMGYSIPSSIEDIYVKAKKFMKYAKILEQIANFHNTIGDRMIPSQRPLMLSSAVHLSKLVQEEEVVYWSDIAAVEQYIDKLKEAVENLSSENNLLTNYHLQILEKIRDLENIDLIKQYQKWKDTAKTIRDILSQVQSKGFKSLQSWRIDLDRQLAKVLEIQYLKSLHTVHLYLPEIYADLIYRDRKLSYSPDEKSLREKYANQMKRFLEIPKSFRGISDNHEIFSEIIDRSKYEIDKVNQNTDSLFDQLQSVLTHWESWLTLESLDNSKLNVWQDWDLHFRASKTFGQEIAKLPSTEEKVGCFVIGLVRLRNDLESHNRCYWDKLILSLKDSIAEDVVKLQVYVDSSTATLNRQPVTMEQIGEADASHANILRDRPQMEELYERMCLKAKTLASWTREQIDSVNRLQAAWERLQSLLENHEHIISKQMQTVKTTLNIASENLNKKIESFGAKWDQVKPRPNSGQIAQDTLSQLHKYLENIKQKKLQWKELMEEKQKILGDFEKFGMSAPEFLYCDEIDVDLTNIENTWSLFEEFYTDFEKLANEEWIVFRKKSYLLEEFLFDWQTKLQKLEPTPLVTRILKEIHNHQGITSTLKLVKGEDFTDKHWMEVYAVLGIGPKPIDTLYLKDFLSASEVLQEKTKELQAICKKAASEVIVRQALAELNHWEVQSHFALTEHLDCKKRTILLIKDFKEILNKIGDNQSLLQSVKNAADFDSFSEQAGIWENRLTDLESFLTNLAQIQRKWVYLEPIYGSGTLNHEAVRFERLDRDFRNVLNFIEKDSRVCALLRYSNLRSVLENLQDQLVRCQKSLDEFLTEKRSKFPRFLFLGDDDLLEVVGQSSQESVIQSHLKKLFAGIHSIKLDKQSSKIVEMCSLEGEAVELYKPVDVHQPVEVWLNLLVDAMQTSLKSLLNKCLADGQNLDPSKYPSQILCLADSVTFTSKCEQAINSMTLPPLLATYKTQLGYYSSLELQSDSNSNSDQENNSNVLELKLKSLLLDTIHHIDVIEELIDDNVTKTTDWTWQKQLKFYVKSSTGDVVVKMANAEMEYSFEYLGNGQKLVRTPLTERCFLTLTQGMFLGMGGNPYGPAGTGKTESVKALGGLLGRQVLVFNCDEGIDASSMGRIISGLVKTGAWGCFDEFNRLDEATLSAISMYIQPIQMALKNKSEAVILLEQEIKVNKHCGIFVTLNPAGGSYGGRNKLPDNLKQLFRPVVMTHPDHEQIARTLLHCNGYKKADTIAGKLVEIFKLSNLLLSKQQHYDWGLRALKTVLNGCSQGMREYKRSLNSNDPMENNFEFAIVTKALKMDTLSKLTFSDHQKFEALVTDVFQEVPKEIVSDNKFREILQESCQELGLYVNKTQLEKCLELHEQLKQRMGVAIVGPPSSGKSTVKKILFHAINKMGHTLREKVFNPKSLPRVQLLGQIDPDTRQWSDGVLSLYSLQVTSEPQNVSSWITCDGDIDPEWVESLNSVLDDNKLLSLPSGWRIQFGSNVSFIFETHELRNASPATISRMGIVFFSEEVVTIENYVTNSIRREIESSGVLESFYNDYFFKAVNWILNEGELIIPCSKIGVVKTALSQLEGISNRAEFTVNLINGLGGQLQDDFKEIFAQQVFKWTEEIAPSEHERIRYNKEQGIIENYTIKHNQTLAKTVSPLIFTAQVCQALDVLGKYLRKGKEQHFLLIGPHGSAKSLIIEYLVKITSEMDMSTVYCSAHVTPQYLIHKFKQNCIIVNSNKGRIFKPKKGHLVMYFKNVHLLKPDKWGTNILIEFLQQLITYAGFFDEGLEWIGIENVTIVGSLSITSNLSIRFSSLLHIYNIELPEKEDLHLICSTYLQNTLKEITSSNDSWLKRKLSKLASTMISIYNEVKETLKPNEHRHYAFSPHEITYWCQNLLRYKRENDQVESDDFIIEMVCKEALHIFGSRLVSDTDRTKLNTILNNIFLSDWSKSYLTDKVSNSFYIPNFASTRNMSVLSKAEDVDWFSMVKKGVMLYEREGHILNLLFIPELLNLIATLSRSLTRDSGSVLLVGSSGVGRKSAARIVSALQSSKLVVPNSAKSFSNDLKYAMQQSGIGGESVILILEDHLFNDTILNIISILLSSGEVPGLYNPIEFESLISALRDEASREGFEGNLCDYFVERVRRKLHIVVCLDTKNDQLWEILADYPVLFQQCDVIWQNEWSTKTMENVPNMLIDKHNKENPNELVELSSGFSNIHKSIESGSETTPLRFIELIKNYVRFYVEKKNLVTKKKSKLQVGVDKLTEARSIVADLKIKAAEQQEKLAEKQSKANAALDMISNTMEHANTQKQEMEILKRNTENENEQLIKRKQEIELELAEVEPLIKEAAAAVGNIKAEALSEIRSLRAPPDIIRDILEGVLRLMGIQDTSWNSMKTFLAKRGVKEDIRSFDASRITTENRHAVEKLLQNKSDSFDPKSSKRASVAAAPLAAWVTANVRYSHVLDKIKPLTKEQNRLQRNLETAKLQLGELSSGLTNVDATVAKLKEQLSTYTKEAAEIEIHLGMAQETLQAAEGLVDKLNDEYNRWQTQLLELSEEMLRLPSYCLLAAAFVTYLSGKPEDIRLKLLETWKLIIGQGAVNQFTLEDFLSSERENLQWQSEGLGSDQLSIQNAIIMLNFYIIPLVIDPTSMAFDWIKQHFKKKSLENVNENSPKFNTILELAIRFGKILIIEDVNYISSMLLPILRKEFVHSGERKMISLNGKLIDCHNDFRLILTSRNSQFKLPAYLSSSVMLVNFSITHSGLTEKLLIGAIRQENPQLEERRKQLLKEREEMQEKQYNLQNQLLEDLANSSGNILENKSLLESLNETKASSNAISKALQQSNEVRQKLSEEYEIYKDISAFGSSLYFAIVEFSKMNVLYSLSVHSYTKLFLKSLSSSQGIENTFGFLQRVLVQSVYQFVGRGILKADRLKFILHLIHAIYPKQVPDEEWNFFLGQTTISKIDSKPDSNVPNWIPEQLHHQIQLLQVYQPNIFTALNLPESTAWKDFMNGSKSETKFPQHVKLTEFQKILVIQILRPDRLYSALTQFCLHITGLKNLNMDVLQLSQILQESSSSEPILLLTTSGNDPSAEIRELAEGKRGTGKYIEIAMGEGQEIKAVSSLQEANENGYWIILKNLHLVSNWLPILLQELQNLKPNPEFRIWLITESQNSFNLVLAQNSLKIAYEAPQGVRNNLLRTYANWGPDYVQSLKPTNARIFFILACINALLQERRTYIPQGWSKWYDFSDVDLTAAVKLTSPALSPNNSQVPWKYLKGLCADAVYGGRIENIQDFSILESYLNEYFMDEVLSHRWKPFDLSNSIRLSTKYDDYVNAILQLSQRDLPSYFGLSENIDRSWEKNISKEAIADLKALEGDKIKHSTFNRQIWQRGLTPYINLWKKLNQGQDFVKISLKEFVENFEQSSILNFIQEELRNAVFLIQKIHKHFTSLNRLLRANTLPDDKTSELAISLLNQQVPKSWSKMWNGPMDPNKYLRYVIVKTVKIRNWQSEEIKYFFTVPMNLSLLFNPETFLAAFKQHYSRDHKVPLDELIMQTNWKTTQNSIILEGLLISGAIFDGFLLSACTANTESINPVPNCYITWIHRKNAVINDKIINVPLYYTSDRNKQVTQIQVPCDSKEKDKWIRAGLAFFLSY